MIPHRRLPVAALLCLMTALVGAAAAALCAAPLTALHEHLARGSVGDASFDLLLSAAASATLAVTVLWLVLVTLAAVVEAATGLSSATLRAVSPTVVRRLAAVACGVAMGTVNTLPAGAVGLLDGLPLPDRATGAVAPVPAYTVRPGDSLWALAARLLPATAPTSAVDSAWRRIHRVNLRAIGPDPDVIVPGTRLHLPASLGAAAPARPSAPHASEPRSPRKDAS